MSTQEIAIALAVSIRYIIRYPTNRQTKDGTNVATQLTLSNPPTIWITASTCQLVIKEQIVTGTGPVKGRRISIVPSGFGAQIAVEQTVAPAFAAGTRLTLIAPSRVVVNVNIKSLLFTNFTFLVGDISEAWIKNQLYRGNLIEK